MSDIVKRLRDLARVDNCKASLEAADEIERLRAVVEHIYQCSSDRRVIEMARAELERSHDR